MKQNIYEKTEMAIYPYLITYEFGCAIYDEQKISGGRRISNDFLIIRVPTNMSVQGIFICSFYRLGYGFFLKNSAFTESFQVYKATDSLDYYYAIYSVTENNGQLIRTEKVVYNKTELLVFLTKYFEEKESLFYSGYFDAAKRGFAEYIK